MVPPVNGPPIAAADTTFVLGQIIGKLDGIQNTLTAIVQRADGHENRIHALEQVASHRASVGPRVDTLETKVDSLESSRDQVKGGWSMANILWPILAAVAGVIGGQYVHIDGGKDQVPPAITAPHKP